MFFPQMSVEIRSNVGRKLSVAFGYMCRECTTGIYHVRKFVPGETLDNPYF